MIYLDVIEKKLKQSILITINKKRISHYMLWNNQLIYYKTYFSVYSEKYWIRAIKKLIFFNRQRLYRDFIEHLKSQM